MMVAKNVCAECHATIELGVAQVQVRAGAELQVFRHYDAVICTKNLPPRPMLPSTDLALSSHIMDLATVVEHLAGGTRTPSWCAEAAASICRTVALRRRERQP